MDGRQRYLQFQDIADVATKCDGTIFGGFVRDFLRHEHCAKEFYRAHKAEDYGNASVAPELEDRLLVPQDIDVQFKTKLAYQKFRSELRARFYRTQVASITNVYSGFRNSHHLKLNVWLELDKAAIMRRLKMPGGIVRELLDFDFEPISHDCIQVDVILSSHQPNLEDLDFRCNGLVMDRDGIRPGDCITQYMGPVGIHRVFMGLLDEIHQKRAVVVTLKTHRWNKMADKGWELTGTTVEKVNRSGERCILCHDDIPCQQVFKLDCCSASYHKSCLTDFMQYPERGLLATQKCPHCKDGVYPGKTHLEILGVPHEPQEEQDAW